MVVCTKLVTLTHWYFGSSSAFISDLSYQVKLVIVDCSVAAVGIELQETVDVAVLAAVRAAA